MTPELKQMLEQWKKLSLSDRYEFEKTIQIARGRNIALDGVIGTKIGTSALQKLGLWGATPVVQAGAISAANSQGGTYNQTDVQSIASAVNSIRTALTNAGITA